MSSEKSSYVQNAKILSITISSSLFAETTTFPLDLIKTKIQLEGDAQKLKKEHAPSHNLVKSAGKVSRNKRSPLFTEIRSFGTAASFDWQLPKWKNSKIWKFFRISKISNPRTTSTGYTEIAFRTYKSEGLKSFYKGLTPALMRHAVYSGTRVTLYEYGREKVYQRNGQNVPGHNQLSMTQATLLAGFSGFFAQFIANPTDLLKVRMQSGEYKNLKQAFKSVPNYKSFWNGVSPNLGRAFMVNQGDLMTYDKLKRYLLEKSNDENSVISSKFKFLNIKEGSSSTLHFLSSFGAGLVACLLAMPFDTIKSRIMNQPIDKITGQGMYYKNMGQAFYLIVRNEGIFSLYRGFFVAWPRMAIWSQCFWHFNENIRGVLDLKPF